MSKDLDSKGMRDGIPQRPTDQNNANRLGTEPVGKLLLEYALPAIIGMTASSLYSVIDRIFIGNGVGPFAISGLALTMPLMNLTIAFGAMIGAGASTMVSIRLGQKRKEEATHILCNTLLLNFIISCCVSALGLIFLNPILRAFGASDATLPYARDFMRIILVANIFNHNFVGLNNVMRASGYPRKAMWSTLLTVIINICLAPLFIFVFHWGIKGAALATSISQFCGFVWVMAHFLNPGHFLHFQRGFFGLRERIIKDILAIGVSPFFMNVGASMVAMIFNISLSKYGGGGMHSDMAIGAYGIVNSVAILFIMICLGLTMGMQPIVGFNYGARQNDRVLKAFKKAAIGATAITTIGFLLAVLLPRQLASLFTHDEELIRQSVFALRTVLLLFPIVGFQMVTSNFFQSVGKAYIAIVLSMSRQFLFLIPFLLIFPHFWGLKGVWFAAPAGDILASILTITLLLTKLKTLLPIETTPKA
jgi:putative MATE family efflux protein